MLKDLLRKGDWLAKIDLKVAFSLTKISQVHLQRKGIPVQLSPFGLSSVPWVLIKTLKPAIAIFSKRGVSLIAYIDNLRINSNKVLGLDHVTGMQHLLERLEYIVNTKKSVLNPAQVIEFLELSIDSIALEIRLSLAKIKQI